SIDIGSGIVGLVGQNGAGKSTLLRLISGVLYPSDGVITINGKEALSKEAKRDVFFLPDNPYALLRSNVKDVVDLYSNFYKIDIECFNRLLAKFKLPLNRRVTNFSKGMKRQLFVALALSIQVPILLLDEAFDGLDPLAMDVIKEEIINLNSEGKTIVISSHNISALERLVDRFIILYKGVLRSDGSNEHLGENFLKYQGVFNTPLSEKQLLLLGIKVVSFKKVGSIYNFVVLDQELLEQKINEAYAPVLLERIPIDPDEVITLEMLLATKEDQNNG
ncbi:MAG: ABC transporter ATP-binding protein, partial [Acidaminococcaceae bacterium]